MSNLVLHPQTKRSMDIFLERPTHALLLTGPAGIGKASLARQLANSLLDSTDDTASPRAYYREVSPEKGTISIENIRDIHEFLKRKTIGNADIRRVVVVDQAQTMTPEAQNAFLKDLEEPPEDTVFLLTAEQTKQLLPTIVSRLQVLSVYRPSEEALEEAFGTSAKFQSSYSLSGGLPGLLAALLDEDSEHPLVGAVEQAKRLLQAPVFTRLADMDSLASKKEDAVQLLTALKRIAQAGLEQAARKNPALLSRWSRVLRLSTEAEEAVSKNANVKLVMTKVLLSI